jgi:hypothetical protein
LREGEIYRPLHHLSPLSSNTIDSLLYFQKLSPAFHVRRALLASSKKEIAIGDVVWSGPSLVKTEKQHPKDYAKPFLLWNSCILVWWCGSFAPLSIVRGEDETRVVYINLPPLVSLLPLYYTLLERCSKRGINKQDDLLFLPSGVLKTAEGMEDVCPSVLLSTEARYTTRLVKRFEV